MWVPCWIIIYYFAFIEEATSYLVCVIIVFGRNIVVISTAELGCPSRFGSINLVETELEFNPTRTLVTWLAKAVLYFYLFVPLAHYFWHRVRAEFWDRPSIECLGEFSLMRKAIYTWVYSGLYLENYFGFRISNTAKLFGNTHFGPSAPIVLVGSNNYITILILGFHISVKGFRDAWIQDFLTRITLLIGRWIPSFKTSASSNNHLK